MKMFWELLEVVIKCMIVFQQLNFDQWNKYLKYNVTLLYFNKESDYFKENAFENEVFCSTIERNKTYSHLSCWFIRYSMRIENLDWSKCQKQPLQVFWKKRYSLKCPKIHRKLLCQRKHLYFAKFLRTPLLQNIALLLWLKSQGAREASHHPVFMEICPAISHRY